MNECKKLLPIPGNYFFSFFSVAAQGCFRTDLNAKHFHLIALHLGTAINDEGMKESFFLTKVTFFHVESHFYFLIYESWLKTFGIMLWLSTCADWLSKFR